jgi:hypothetical protein
LSGDVHTLISSFSVDITAQPCDIVRLHDPEIVIGKLSDIIEPDGQEFLLARIAGELIELPKPLSEQLWGLMGQKVIVGLVARLYRAGVSTQ